MGSIQHKGEAGVSRLMVKTDIEVKSCGASLESNWPGQKAPGQFFTMKKTDTIPNVSKHVERRITQQ